MSNVDPIRAELDALRSELAALREGRPGTAGESNGEPTTGGGGDALADAAAVASGAARKVSGWLNNLDVSSVMRELQDALGEAGSMAEQSVANRPVVIVGSALLLGFLLGRLSRTSR